MWKNWPRVLDDCTVFSARLNPALPIEWAGGDSGSAGSIRRALAALGVLEKPKAVFLRKTLPEA